MWFHKDYFKQLERPTRIRLPDGSTRTGEAVTDELLAAAGWVELGEDVFHDNPPQP